MKYQLIQTTEEFSSAYTARGESYNVGSEGCDSFSAACVVTVDTPSAKTFDSGVAASLVNQDITYTANVRGVAGNSITITLVDPGGTEALDISVVGTDIVVSLETNTGSVVTDADALVAAINLDVDAAALITASGTGNTPLTALAETPLANGAASEVSVGASKVTTLTFATKAATGTSDFVVIYDVQGRPWGVYADKTGADAAPTANVWGSIPSAQKGAANISAATTAAQVAAAFELAFDALASVPFATDDSAADGTMLITMTARGPADDAVVSNASGSGEGSIAEVETTAGAYSQLTIPAHGLQEGLKGQFTTTGTLPTGISLGTDYFVIPIDENTIAVASSLANAQVGLAVNITTQGASASVNTFTPTSIAGGAIKLQQSNDGVVWFDSGSSTNITTTANFLLEKDRPTMKYMAVHITLTAGHISAEFQVLGKGDKAG